jgi:hypothetical protein
MSLTEFEQTTLKLAETTERVETDAPTLEQTDIAAAVVRLAWDAPSTGLQIHTCDMTSEDWKALADAYRTVGDRAEAQSRTIEGTVMAKPVPRLSEIVWARGCQEPEDPYLHVVIILGRENIDDPLDRDPRQALCGAEAVPSQALAGHVVRIGLELCCECRVQLRIIHRRIRHGSGGADA